MQGRSAPIQQDGLFIFPSLLTLITNADILLL
nr:MAG TPA: hypothetical protein [Caudoviricetes sp.]